MACKVDRFKTRTSCGILGFGAGINALYEMILFAELIHIELYKIEPWWCLGVFKL